MEVEEKFDLVFATQYFDKIYPKLLLRGALSNIYLEKVYVPNNMGRKQPFDSDIIPQITSEEWQWLEQQLEDERSLQLLAYIKAERQSPAYPSKSFVPIDVGFHHAGSCDYWDTICGKRTHEHAVVIDAGAYIGDDIAKIVKNVSGGVKAYYAFEPMQQSFERLKAKTVKQIDAFIPLKKALGKENAITVFGCSQSDLLSFSYLDKSSEHTETVEIVTIDSLQLSEDADYFVKMDIEGSELDALMGAKTFIQRKRPNLAICLYHKNRDIIEIPQFLKSLVPDYRLYLVGGSHTILIAQ